MPLTWCKCMPYKEAIKHKVESNSTTLIKKSKYKVRNCTDYNKSLKIVE